MRWKTLSIPPYDLFLLLYKQASAYATMKSIFALTQVLRSFFPDHASAWPLLLTSPPSFHVYFQKGLGSLFFGMLLDRYGVKTGALELSAPTYLRLF